MGKLNKDSNSYTIIYTAVMIIIVAVALAQCIIISAKEAAYLVGMVGSQINTSFTTEAISPKILSHYRYFSSSKE